MWHVVLTLGVLNLLAAMSPGPDFAIVTTNTLVYSRRTGIMTALGIASAVLVHVAYCLLGFAILIAEIAWLFRVIELLGGAYLAYVGWNALHSFRHIGRPAASARTTRRLSLWVAWRQGFLTNLLNAKCILLFIAMFTYVPIHALTWPLGITIEVELFFVVFGWFSLLSWMLTHPLWRRALQRATPVIVFLMGVLLLAIGIWLLVEGVLFIFS